MLVNRITMQARPEGIEPSTDRVRPSRNCAGLTDRIERGDTGREAEKHVHIAVNIAVKRSLPRLRAFAYWRNASTSLGASLIAYVQIKSGSVR